MSLEVVYLVAAVLVLFFSLRILFVLRRSGGLSAPQRAMYRVTLVVLALAFVALGISYFRLRK